MDTAATDRKYARLHRIGVTLCVLTFMLIVWGGHVNTTRSGMAFPDWPTSNAAPMVT
jgi:heme A synthase